MLNKYARAFFTRVLTPFATFLIRRGVSPDTVTLLGTAGVVAGALVFYPMGEFFWGTVVITLFVFSDLVDGNMARQLGRSSRWGAFLDSTLDRVADGAIFGGFALWYAGGGDDIALCAVSIFCLASGQVVSYTKARGESIGLPVAVNGLVERAERLVISLVAAGLAGLHKFGVPGIQYLLPVALWIVAVGSMVTLIQRVVTVRRESAEAEAAAEPGAVEPGAAESAAAGRDGVGSDGAGSGDAESAAVEEKQKSQEQGSEAAK
jgi:CDP-diacylglycerol---glycerol-3-phosphate 3-phosphatidyltransferase